MKLKEDILTLIQDLKKKQATSIEGIAARHVLNELEKEIQAMKPEKHEINLLFGETGNTLAYKQKFNVGDTVYVIDNKTSKNGGIERDGYMIRDSVITGVHIDIANRSTRRKVVFYKDSYTTRIEYSVSHIRGRVPESNIFPTLEVAQAHTRKMKESYPEISVKKSLEGYQIEWQ